MGDNYATVWAVAISALIALAISLGAVGDEPRTIKTTGLATQSVQPDRYTVNLTVEQESTEAEQATKVVALLTDNIREQLEENGVKVTTGYYAVYPVYSEVYPLTTEGEQLNICIAIYPVPPECQPHTVVVGYRAVHELSAAGDLNDSSPGETIDLAVKSGATRVNGVQFDISDKSRGEIRNDLIEDAMIDARSKAEAAAYGDKFTALSVEVSDYGWTPVFFKEADAGTEILPREIGVSASVSVTFEVR